MVIALPLALFATALLLGGMVFFSLIVTPMVFRALPREEAGALLQRIFPVYYLYVLGCSAVAGLCFLTFRPDEASLMAAVTLAAFWLRQILGPRLARLRPGRLAGDEEAVTAFGKAHRLSVILNLGQMILAATVLGRFVL